MDISGLTDDQLSELNTAELRDAVRIEPQYQIASIERIIEALACPDPDVREWGGYGLLWRICVRPGLLEPENLWVLGEKLAACFGPDEPLLRKCYACLGLACLASVNVHRDEWTTGFAAWWTAETNTLGKDPEQGWFHAVAHGSDYLDELAKANLIPASQLLSWAADRMLVEPDAEGQGDRRGVWAAQEDTRLAIAVTSALAQCELGDADDFIERLTPVIAFPQPAPIPAAHSNSVRTIRAIISHIAFDDNATAVQRDVAKKLAAVVVLPSS